MFEMKKNDDKNLFLAKKDIKNYKFAGAPDATGNEIFALFVIYLPRERYDFAGIRELRCATHKSSYIRF